MFKDFLGKKWDPCLRISCKKSDPLGRHIPVRPNMWVPPRKSLHWLPIEKRILFKLIVQAFKAFHFSFPGYLSSYFQSCVHKTKYSLRSDLAITFEVPHAKKQAGDRAFSVTWPHLWNGLPSSVSTFDHMDRFKNKLKSHLFLDSSKHFEHIVKGARYKSHYCYYYYYNYYYYRYYYITACKFTTILYK